MKLLKDELLTQPFQLAYFIHDDKETAKRITMAALERLETATRKQDRRLYYFSVGRRNRISFTSLHLLQRLVYDESENYEKRREHDLACPLSEERLLVHFIKHLVKITVRRKSLYVALGLSRILHRYTTAETTEIYNVVIQDPARVSDEDYFRAGKKLLMSELESRFGELLAVTRGARGERRFAVRDRPEGFATLVSSCLSVFTPWQTDSHVPERFNPITDELPALRFNGADPDEEHSVEVNRFHALLHPTCFARLLRALGFAPSEQRLEIPQFCLASRGDEDDADMDDPSGPAELDEDDRNDIRDYLDKQNRRRKSLKAGLLSFVADGAEVARLDLRQAGPIRFQLPEYAEFLEIRSRDAQGEILLATHPLAYGDDDRLKPQNAVIVLGRGQRLAFTIAPTPDSAVAEVSYQETNWPRALRLWLTQRIERISSAPPSGLLASFAIALLTVTATTFGLFWYRERQSELVARQTLAQLDARRQQAEERIDQLDRMNRETQTSLQEAEQGRRAAEDRTQQLQRQFETRLKEAARNVNPQARPNLYVETLRLAALRSAGDILTLDLPAGAQTIVLLLEISRPLDYPAYTVEVRDADGKIVTKLSGLNPRLTRDNQLSVSLARTAFQSGVYQLRLFGRRGAEEKDFGAYPLRLQFN
jgi:hypothetical protein